MKATTSTCELCDGTKATLKGYKPDGLPMFVRCICETKRMWIAKLGMQIISSPKLKKPSPLEKYASQDIFVRGPEQKFFSHLKVSLIKQGLDFNFIVMNDNKVFNIWIGKDKEFDSLQDLVVFDLVVIMLGATVYENRAHAAVMNEAVHVRLLEGKPTWVHSALELDEVLMSKQSAPEYVDQFKGLIESHFKRIELGGTTTVHQEMKSSKTKAGVASQNMAHGILSSSTTNGKKR